LCLLSKFRATGSPRVPPLKARAKDLFPPFPLPFLLRSSRRRVRTPRNPPFSESFQEYETASVRVLPFFHPSGSKKLLRSFLAFSRNGGRRAMAGLRLPFLGKVSAVVPPPSLFFPPSCRAKCKEMTIFPSLSPTLVQGIPEKPPHCFFSPVPSPWTNSSLFFPSSLPFSSMCKRKVASSPFSA